MRDCRSLLSALAIALALAVACPGRAAANTFEAGSLIIPMDTDYQDVGMLQAFGLLHALLRAGVPVAWTIRPGKLAFESDFTVAGIDHATGVPFAAHAYRAGPFVIAAADAPAALPVIDAWQRTHTTAVHEARAAFWADVSRYLINAPNIAMFADGNQDIAVGYLGAADIPDSNGNPWPASSPDLLTIAQVSGPTTTNHGDGRLFDADGDPAYCQLMSMHWGVGDAVRDPEVVAEVRAFLNNPVHFFAECQAVSAFENVGRFLTPYGFLIDNWGGAVDYLNADQPFTQLDAPFSIVGGSERAYSPCRDAPPAACVRGGSYRVGGIVMMTRAGTPEGLQDVWMTGYLDGACPPGAESCYGLGKISYLGGHQYNTRTPMTAHADTWGTRLFLQSLFEAPCATYAGIPSVILDKAGPASTSSATVTYTLSYFNGGPGVALRAVLTDPIPAGSTFVSATGGGTFASGVVTWNLGNLGVGESGTVTVTVRFPSFGTYRNSSRVTFRVGVTPRFEDSRTVTTIYDVDTDGDGVVDSLDSCPTIPNPWQDLLSDVLNCGACGNACANAHSTPYCTLGACRVAACDVGWTDCDGSDATGCEYDITAFASDPLNCGGCGVVCSAPSAVSSCAGSTCGIASCLGGFVDLDRDPTNGCEYACAATATSDTTCDLTDDDCDGLVDDDYATVATSCGVGACAAAGTRTCVAGVQVDDCAAGTAGVESGLGTAACENGSDDDCDGLTDALDPGCAVCLSDPACDDGDPCTVDMCVTGACAHGADPACVVDAGTDAGTATSDAGTATSDAGTATSDAGTATSDAGSATGDSGTAIDDAGTATADAGTATGDSGTATDDAGASGSDAGLVGRDAGTTGGDGSAAGADAGMTGPGTPDDGGCGCSVPGRDRSSTRPLVLLGLALLLVGARRRARRG